MSGFIDPSGPNQPYTISLLLLLLRQQQQQQQQLSYPASFPACNRRYAYIAGKSSR